MKTEFVVKSTFKVSFGEVEDLICLKLIKLLKISIRGFFLVNNVRVVVHKKCNCKLAAEILSRAYLHRSILMGIWGHFFEDAFSILSSERQVHLTPDMYSWLFEIVMNTFKWLFQEILIMGQTADHEVFMMFRSMEGLWSFELAKIKRSKERLWSLSLDHKASQRLILNRTVNRKNMSVLNRNSAVEKLMFFYGVKYFWQFFWGWGFFL